MRPEEKKMLILAYLVREKKMCGCDLEREM
jgi:hypothetical protein